jgi:hypothetical protein
VSGGSVLRLTSELTPVRPLLRRIGRVAPWVSRWGHDRVLHTGLRRFTHAALGQHGRSDPLDR